MKSELVDTIAKLKDKILNVTYDNEEDKVNYIIKELVDDGIELDDVIRFFNLSNNFNNKIVNPIYINYINYNKQKLNYKDIIMYSRKVIESIDRDLLEDFDSFINSDYIKLYNKNNINVVFGNIKNRCITKDHDNYNKNIITMIKEGDYNDITILVHEFLHTTNSVNKKNDYSIESVVRKKYTEFISIYFEKYTVDYLNKYYSIPKDYFDNKYRINSNRKLSNVYIDSFLPFVLYDEYGKIDKESFDKKLDELNINISYDDMLNSFIKYFSNIYSDIKEVEFLKEEHPNLIKLDKKKETVCNKYNLDLYHISNHFIGSLLYYKYKNIIKPNEVLKLSYLLNKDYKEIKDNPIFKKFELLYKNLDDESVINMNNDVINLANINKKRGSL